MILPLLLLLLILPLPLPRLPLLPPPQVFAPLLPPPPPPPPLPDTLFKYHLLSSSCFSSPLNLFCQAYSLRVTASHICGACSHAADGTCCSRWPDTFKSSLRNCLVEKYFQRIFPFSSTSRKEEVQVANNDSPKDILKKRYFKIKIDLKHARA